MKTQKEIMIKQFMFLSDAKKFQKQKRKEGFKTKLKHYLGIASPYREVIFYKD